MDKLRSRRGETLTETLAAILIVSLASVVLLTMSVVSVRIDRAAEAADRQLRLEQEAVERRESPTADAVDIQTGLGTDVWPVSRSGGGGSLSGYDLWKEREP